MSYTIPEHSTTVVETIVKIICAGNGMANIFTDIRKSVWRCIISFSKFLELKYLRGQTII